MQAQGREMRSPIIYVLPFSKVSSPLFMTVYRWLPVFQLEVLADTPVSAPPRINLAIF